MVFGTVRPVISLTLDRLKDLDWGHGRGGEASATTAPVMAPPCTAVDMLAKFHRLTVTTTATSATATPLRCHLRIGGKAAPQHDKASNRNFVPVGDK
jgi:hypothetical protein